MEKKKRIHYGGDRIVEYGTLETSTTVYVNFTETEIFQK